MLSSQLIILLEGDDDEEYLDKLLDKTRQRERLRNFRIAIETTGGNKIIDLDIIDKLNKNPIPVLLVRDGDERIISQEKGNHGYIWK